MISGDPKRADIIIAGGIVLHEIMSAVELGLFVCVAPRPARRLDGRSVAALLPRLRAHGIRMPTVPSRSSKSVRNTPTTSPIPAR